MSTYDPSLTPVFAVFEILAMGDPPRYVNGGEVFDDGSDDVGDNPTERKRKSSARTRRKKLRRLFGGTEWDPGKDPGKTN